MSEINAPQPVNPATDPGVKSSSFRPNGNSISTVSSPVPGAASAAAPGDNRKADDSAGPTLVGSQLNVNAAGNQTIDRVDPRPNVLSNYASYTYRASVYLLTPGQYNAFMGGDRKVVNSYNLLFQSGGAPDNVGGFQKALASKSIAADTTEANQANAGRNPAFDLDFYIDDIELVTLTAGKATRSAHSAATLKFTVVEPNGISLIDRIYQAVQDQAPRGAGGTINYGASAYLMVLKFYGYDANGNLVTGISEPGAGARTDPSAIVEKYIPFRIAKINWGISNKTVTYDFECLPYGQGIGFGTKRGTIPYDIQLSEITVGQLLGGGTVYADSVTVDQRGRQTAESDPRVLRGLDRAGNPSKANSAPSAKRYIKQGLMAALNEFQRTLLVGPNARARIADEYRIEFAEGAEEIRDATVVLVGNKKEDAQTPMAAPTSQSPSNVNQDRLSKDTTSKNYAITAGMQIVQAIELAIRNSSYVYNQATTQIDATTGDEVAKDGQTKPVSWFHITSYSEQIEPYDDLRNDYAQRVTFVISKYQLTNYESKYFAPPKFPGVHKSYQYWFTGENTEVLDYQEQLNTLFNITVSGSNPNNSLAELTRRSLIQAQRDQPFYQYSPASAESRQGSDGRGNEVAASLADSLYSPGDLAVCKMKILGDPAWIQQGSLAYGRQVQPSGPFNPDGSINYESAQVMFEINWNRPFDYNADSGVIDPRGKTSSVATRVYQCYKVTNDFKQGKFEQTIEGGLYLYLKPNPTNKAYSIQTPSLLENSDSSRNNPQASANFGLSSPQAVARADSGQARLSLPQSTGLGLRAAGTSVISTGGVTGSVSAGQFGRANLPMMPAPLVASARTVQGTNVPNQQPAPTLDFSSPPQPPTSGIGGAEEVVATFDLPVVKRLTNNALLETNSLTATNLAQKINKET